MTLDMIILKTLDGSSTLEVSVYVTCRGLRRVSEVRYYLPQGWALMLSKIKAMLDQMKSYVFKIEFKVGIRFRAIGSEQIKDMGRYSQASMRGRWTIFTSAQFLERDIANDYIFVQIPLPLPLRPLAQILVIDSAFYRAPSNTRNRQHKMKCKRNCYPNVIKLRKGIDTVK